MRVFNPEKELSKIKNGNKKKIIISICALLVVGILGYSFALYQVRHTQKLVFNTVGEFKKRDIILSVLVDGETKPEFPGRDDGYVFERLDCDKEGTSATFDKESWELVLRTNKPNKCTVVFGSKPNEPELFQGLIPITIDDDGTIKVADTDSEWYDYGEHKWANAVLVTTAKYNELTQDNQLRKDKAGIVLSLDTDILQMYVWIPRYKYQLFNVNNEAVPEQMINIVFENGTETTGNVACKYTKGENGSITEDCKNGEKKADNGDWYTHPAFTFKGTFEDSGEELSGIWVGKFESSGIKSSNQITNLKIIPNISPLSYLQVSYIFQGIRDIEEKYSSSYNINPPEIDTHLIKNMEWGAIAYLTQSVYGRCNNGNCVEVTRNVFSETGYAGQEESWNTNNGTKASTTGNVYGIYDLNGCSWEYVMSNMVDNNGDFSVGNSNFDIITESYYYDVYSYGNSLYDYSRGHLGDATRETIKIFNDVNGQWYGDYARFINNGESWLKRGGRVGDGLERAGIFAFYSDSGSGAADTSFRIVLTAQNN